MEKMRLSTSHIDGQDYLLDSRYAGVHVDRAADAESWATSHGMRPAYDVEDDKGNVYTIWKSERFITAIPA